MNTIPQEEMLQVTINLETVFNNHLFIRNTTEKCER